MHLNRIFFLLCVCLVAGCKQPETFPILLPESNYHNDKYDNKGFDHFLTITQYSDTSVLLEYDTSIIATIDSSLHAKMFGLVSHAIYDYGLMLKARLLLDREMPISTYKQLLLECRKIDLRNIWMMTADSLPVSMMVYPIFRRDEIYFDPEAMLQLPPPPPVPPTFDLLQRPNLKIDISHEHIRISDFQDSVISDFKNYLMDNPKTFNIYQFEPSCTYQDYVTLQSFLFSTINAIRQEAAEADTTLSERDIRRLHPMRSLDIEDCSRSGDSLIFKI